MHNLKELRKNLENFKKKLTERNINFNIEDFTKKDTLNRDLISYIVTHNSDNKLNFFFVFVKKSCFI